MLIEYNFSPVLLKIFDGDQNRANPRKFVIGSVEHH